MTQPENVPNSPELVRPLLNGMKIPEVTIRDSGGAPFHLAATIQTQPALLVFYRGGW
jgi:peroxiredoxin